MCAHQQNKNLTHDWIKIIKELTESPSFDLNNANMSINVILCQFKKSNFEIWQINQNHELNQIFIKLYIVIDLYEIFYAHKGFLSLFKEAGWGWVGVNTFKSYETFIMLFKIHAIPKYSIKSVHHDFWWRLASTLQKLNCFDCIYFTFSDHIFPVALFHRIIYNTKPNNVGIASDVCVNQK